MIWARHAALARVLLLALLPPGMAACRGGSAPGAREARGGGGGGGGAGGVQTQVSRVSLATEGAPSRLRFQPGALAFCDGRGRPMQVDLASGTVGAGGGAAGPCPATPADPNAACDGVPPVTGVRAPPSEPSDIVDLDGWSVPVDGRVHDCAGDRHALAIATGSSVLLVDSARRTTVKVSGDGADRVALGPGWIAWSQGARIHLTRASASKP